MMRVLSLCCVLVGSAVAQTKALARPHVDGPVQVKARPAVARGVVAIPEVAGGVLPEVAAKVNAATRKLNERVAAAALDCRQSFRSMKHKPSAEAWTRDVAVTMPGPGYLSLVATDSYYCGGPYPNDGLLLPLVYDLRTGSTLNWLKLLPPGPSSSVDESGDGSRIGAIIWPVLTEMAKAKADKECAEAFSDEEVVSFVLWLDARQGAIVARPSSFPHVIAACAVPVAISIAKARQIGVRAELVDALEQAHALQR